MAKDVLIPLGLPAAASTAHAATHQKMFGLRVAASIIWNDEIIISKK